MLATMAVPAGSAVPVPVGSAVGMGGLSDRINAALDDFVATRLSAGGGAEGAAGRDGGSAGSSARTGRRSGGRSLRPAFCYWGWRVFEGDPGSKAIITVAAAIELMRRYAAVGRCLAWCGEMFYGCGLPDSRLQAGSLALRLTQAEAKSGEYLRVGQPSRAARSGGVGGARAVRAPIGYPGAGYGVLRPLQIGAMLAGADTGQVQAWEAFALPLGEAFALREDVAGAFGGATATGRAAGDDLRDGKATVLIAIASRQATASQRAEIEELYGSPGLDAGGRERLRSIIARSGALAVVEDRIIGLVDDSLRALERLPAPGDIKEALSSRAFAAFCGAA